MPIKLPAPENLNYAAVVVKIATINPLAGSDNIVGTPLLGFQAIVGKATQPGDIGIVFPAECQLSDQFCRENSLYRHANLNKDESTKGYIEDNRRIRAVKFRGHRSDCLFMPLSSLAYTGIDVSSLAVGDVFDTLGEHKICEKYQVKRRSNSMAMAKRVRFTRIDAKFLPEHIDSDNYFRNVAKIPAGSAVIITQKLHGTSVRIGHTIVARKLGFIETLLKRFGVRIQESEYDYVFGSRKVIKDAHNPDGGFYSSDIWVDTGKRVEGILPQNFILYGEVVGWLPEGGAIQKHYSYGQETGTNELYVYRVAFINAQGRLTDLSWDQLKLFCTELGLKYVPELWRGKIEDFDVQSFMDVRYFEGGYGHAVPLDSQADIVDEGVCVRLEGLTPYILKAKSPVFLNHESKMLDEEAVDLEAEAALLPE